MRLTLVHLDGHKICSSNKVFLSKLNNVRHDLLCIHGERFYPVYFGDGWVKENVEETGTTIKPLVEPLVEWEKLGPGLPDKV